MSKLGVFLPNWLGDAVMATPALRALANRPNTYNGSTGFRSRDSSSAHGNSGDATAELMNDALNDNRMDGRQLIGIMQPGVADVLSGLPWIDRSLLFSRRKRQGCASRFGLIAQLRREKLDAIVLLTNSWWTALVARLAGIPRRIGYARDGRSWLLTDRVPTPKADGKFAKIPAIDYYLALAQQLDCCTNDRRMQLCITPGENQLADKLWSDLAFSAERTTVVINSSGAWGAAKLWPVDHVERLARRMAQERPWQVLLHCGPSERAAADAVAARVDHPRVRSMGHASDLPVGLTKAVLARAAVVVSTDSGPRHIAVALDREVVSLFGPTDPAWTTTYNRPERMLGVELACRGCWKKTCPLEHHRCMRDLGVEQVFWNVVSAVEQSQRSLYRAA